MNSNIIKNKIIIMSIICTIIIFIKQLAAAFRGRLGRKEAAQEQRKKDAEDQKRYEAELEANRPKPRQISRPKGKSYSGF